MNQRFPYVAELEPNQIATGIYLVTHKDIRQKKSGDPFLTLLLCDRTGEVEAKMWDNVAEVMDTFSRDDFVKVKGLLQIFQNRPQFTVHKIMRMDEREVNVRDFFPASARDPEEMFGELRGVADSIRDPHLSALVRSFLDDEEIARGFRAAPAAKAIHHAYLGGLIEHVLSLCHLARMAAGHYPGIDLDLLLTGVILHDIGKIVELSYGRSFLYSDEGQLLGHIVIGLRMIGERMAGLPDFPARLRTLVEHMIVSHHGELEFGSPKVPLFPEALLLHHLDNLDSKMECMRSSIERDKLVDGCWTTYCAPMDRVFLKKSKFLDGLPGPVPAASPESAPAMVSDPAPPAPPDPPAPVPEEPLPPDPNPVAPPRSSSAPAPAPPNSLFGEKLQLALRRSS
jgi:3'-5' exoribonuclease